MFVSIHCMEKWYISVKNGGLLYFFQIVNSFFMVMVYIDPGTLVLAYFCLDLMIEYIHRAS